MATTDKRRKTVSVTYTDAGDLAASIYTRPDHAGAQHVAETVTIKASDIHASLASRFALYGLAQVWANRYTRLDNPDASEVRKTLDDLLPTVRDGSYVWGSRSVGESEPDDMILAIAEVTGQPVHAVQERIDALLEQPKLDDNGQPRKDARGRIMHLYRRADLYKTFEQDPRKSVTGQTVKSVLARLARERADRLAKEARAHKGDDTGNGALDLFGEVPVAEAAQ